MAATGSIALLAACGSNGTGATSTGSATGSLASSSAAGTSPGSSSAPGSTATGAPASATASSAAGSTASLAASSAPTSSASAAPKAGVTTITWFAARDTTGYTPKQVAEFNAQNPNTPISYQEQGATTTDLHDKFVTIATANDSSADMLSMDVPFVPEFGAAGWTMPMDQVLTPAEQSQFYKGTLDGATYNGKLYALPWYNNGPGLFYRKDLLDGAGLAPPKSYDDLLAAAKKLQTADVNGFIWQAAQTEGGIINWLEYLWGYGGDVVDGKLNIVVDKSPAGQQAMARLVSFIYTDKISPESVLTMKLGSDAENVFNTGKAVFLRQWMTSAATFNKSSSPVSGKWDVVALPSQDGKAAGPGCLGTWNLGISKFSKHQQEAGNAIKFLVTQDQQTKRYLGNGSLPAMPAVFDNAEVQKTYPFAARLKPVFESLKPRPVTPYYGQMSADAIQPNFGAAMGRQKSPDQAIKDMADKLRQIVQQ
jgi:multiple sugar transport system substrate-binding protein